MNRKTARTATGSLAVVVLLALVIADTVMPEIRLTAANRALLLALISALLGVDIVLERWGGVLKEITAGAVEGALASRGGRDDDE